jgi:hypothetical protein
VASSYCWRTKECDGEQRERNDREKGWWSLKQRSLGRERNAAGCAGRDTQQGAKRETPVAGCQDEEEGQHDQALAVSDA